MAYRKMIAAGLLILSAMAPQASAAILIEVKDSAALPGGSGFFDTAISNTGVIAVEIAGFSLDLSVPAASGISFTSVATSPTDLPYIFSGTGFVDLFGDPFSIDAFPNTSFIATDLEFVSLAVTLDPGDELSLGRTFYDVASGADPGLAIEVALGPFTDLSDAFASPVDFDTVNGSIQIGGAVVIPEPESGLIWCLVLSVVVGLRPRRSRLARR